MSLWKKSRLEDPLRRYEGYTLALEREPVSEKRAWKGSVGPEAPPRFFEERKGPQADARVNV
jgi:hypothetical protein